MGTMRLKGPIRLTAGLLTFTIDGKEDQLLSTGTQITVLPDSLELEGGRICKIQVGAQRFWVTAEDLCAATGAGTPGEAVGYPALHC